MAFVEPAEVASLYWFANATTPAADEAPDTVHDSAGANASASRAQGVSRVAAFIVPMCALLLAARDLRAVLTHTLLAPLLLLLALSLAAAAVAAGLAAVALARESEADAARDAATAAHAAAVAPLDAVVRAPQRPWRRTRARLARLVRVLSECDYYPRQRTRGSRVQRQASARGVRGGRTMRVRLVDWRWMRAAPPVADGGVGDPAVAAAAAASSSGSPSRAAEAAVEAAAPPCCPPRFLCAVRGDREKALERWRETEAWRREHPWRATLSRPQPHFERIKQLHRHFIHRTDRAGHPVFYEIIERPNAKFRELREHGVELRDVIAHFHFLYEWLYRVEARARERRNHDIFALVRTPPPIAQVRDADELGHDPAVSRGYLLRIFDLRRVGLADCGGDALRYFKLLGELNRHFPERVFKTLLINVPAAFGTIWALVSPMLDRNVREKVVVCRGDYAATLCELVGEDRVPVEFGGRDDTPSPQEGACAFVRALRAAAKDDEPPPNGGDTTPPQIDDGSAVDCAIAAAIAAAAASSDYDNPPQTPPPPPRTPPRSLRRSRSSPPPPPPRTTDAAVALMSTKSHS